MASGVPIVLTDDLVSKEDKEPVPVIEGHLYLVVDDKRYRVIPFGVDTKISDLHARLDKAESDVAKAETRLSEAEIKLDNISKEQSPKV